jgi:hypothetical protein
MRIVLPGFLVAGVLYWVIGKPWMDHWGATAEEVRESLPGDAIVKRPDFTSTRAITIHAAASAVWPWVVQMGQGRGGFYSYEFLQNLAGSGIHNTGRIEPSLQNLKVGDDFRLHARMPPLRVAALVPDQALVVAAPGEPYMSLEKGLPHVSWAFILHPIDARTTRLLVRFRADHRADWSGSLLSHTMEPVSFLIERKMLVEIRRLAEQLPR